MQFYVQTKKEFNKQLREILDFVFYPIEINHVWVSFVLLKNKYKTTFLSVTIPLRVKHFVHHGKDFCVSEISKFDVISRISTNCVEFIR